MLFASLWAAALAIDAAGAAEPPGRATLIPRPDDCILLPEISHGPLTRPVCGFNAMEMNEAGDRLLTLSVTGRMQLWTPSGEVLAELAQEANNDDQLLLAGGRALLLDGRGHLVLLDAATGAEVARFAGMPGFGRLHRVLDEGLLVMSEELAVASRETMIVRLADGEFVRRQVTGRGPRYASGAVWAAGVTAHRDAAGEWRATLHLADAELTQIPLERWCEPIGPQPQCVGRDIGGSILYVFDVGTRTWSIHDTGAPLIPTTMVDWAQAGGRSFPLICDPAPAVAGVGYGNYACRIVDLADMRILHRFTGGRRLFAGGIGADGEPELRLAVRMGRPDRRYTVSRIALDGTVLEVGRFEYSDFAIAGPAGLLWTREPAPGSPLTARDPAGRVTARIDAGLRNCEHGIPSWYAYRCRVSADRRRIAWLTDDHDVLMAEIEWLGEPPRVTRPD